MLITEENYTNVIENNNVVLKFSRENCAPCKAIEPIFKKLESETLDCVIGIVKVENCPSVVEKYNIRNVPTILFLKKDEMIDKHIGIISETQLREKITLFNNI